MINKIKLLLLKYILFIYRSIFLRKSLLKFNKFLYRLSLRGLGILNYENDILSGEKFIIEKVFKILDDCVVLDIGANVGSYSEQIKNTYPHAIIYAFEPHPKTFKKLELQANKHDFSAINLACSDVEGEFKIYDYQVKGNPENGSSHASLYQDAIQTIHRGATESWTVNVTTVDQFIESNNISKIGLLKVDTEGNDLKVLFGARKAINQEKIDVIQFEFSQLNVISKVFFKDFYDFLSSYSIYRLMPSGLIKIQEYNPIDCEIFAYQNFLAIRKNLVSKFQQILEV